MNDSTISLYHVTDINDPYAVLVVDDPVRPHIPLEDRIGPNKEIVILMDKDKSPLAIVCISYQDYIPTDENELNCSGGPSIAVFYTIWSYAPKAGRQLIKAALNEIKNTKPHITRFVTLSPKTDVAEKFHKANGATVLNVNEHSINYNYT